MTAGRPFRTAFFSVIVALAPSAAIGASLDAHVTAAIPLPGIAEDAPRISPDIAQLKSGLDALAARNIVGARAMRDSLPANSLDRHVLAWAISLYGGDQVPSGDIAATAHMLPDWPGMAALRRNSERALYRENPPPRTVVQVFGGSQPQTMEGVVLLARSYVALNNEKAARSVLSPFWRTEKLDGKDEAAIIAEFGNIIPLPTTASAWNACSIATGSARRGGARDGPAPRTWPMHGRQRSVVKAIHRSC